MRVASARSNEDRIYEEQITVVENRRITFWGQETAHRSSDILLSESATAPVNRSRRRVKTGMQYIVAFSPFIFFRFTFFFLINCLSLSAFTAIPLRVGANNAWQRDGAGHLDPIYRRGRTQVFPRRWPNVTVHFSDG